MEKDEQMKEMLKEMQDKHSAQKLHLEEKLISERKLAESQLKESEQDKLQRLREEYEQEKSQLADELSQQR